MNVLILTGRFGMGHYSAAEAIKQEILLEEYNANIDVVDIIDYMFPIFSGAIYSAFNLMVSKCSGVYNFFNEIAAKHSDIPLKKAVVKKIECLLSEHSADLVIATLPACSQYISTYKKMKSCDIPLYTYITDITAHDEWIAETTDMYFVGSDSTKNILVSKGIPAERVTVCEIPVKQNFKNADYYNDRRIKKEVLIMGGGLGIIPSSDTLIKVLCENDNLHITLIAGRNEKLFYKIKSKFPKVDVIGHTDKVYEYMRRSDLVITKSGGITTFEAIHSKAPLYIIKPFLSQEVGNAKYIESLNIGRVLWAKNIDITVDVLSLLENEQLLDTMRRNMEKVKDSLDSSSPLSVYYRKGENLCG